MNFLACDCEYANSNITIFGAPFDATASNRKGARLAPGAMRQESQQIETYSPYCDLDLENFRIHDCGDLEFQTDDAAEMVEIIEQHSSKLLSDGKIPFMLGGEHLVTLGAVRAAFAKYPDLHIIHFDAHTDLRDEYLGESLSHATVIRKCWDFLGDGRIFQFGIRSGERAEFEWAKTHTALQKFNFSGLDDIVISLAGKPIYFTLDLDVLDPSELCGTGTPEAGGVSFTELRNAIEQVCKLNVVATDVCELAPQLDASGASTAIACKIVREMLLNIRKNI